LSSAQRFSVLGLERFIDQFMVSLLLVFSFIRIN
jgi:hypothetical protein